MTRWTKRQGAAPTESLTPRMFRATRTGGRCSVCDQIIVEGDPILRDVLSAMRLTNSEWRHARCPQRDQHPPLCPHNRTRRSCRECALTYTSEGTSS